MLLNIKARGLWLTETKTITAHYGAIHIVYHFTGPQDDPREQTNSMCTVFHDEPNILFPVYSRTMLRNHFECHSYNHGPI